MDVSYFGNNSSLEGMLIIFGLAFGDERAETLDVIEALKKTSSCDITFLDLNNKDFSQSELEAGVSSFFEKEHSQKSVIIAIHGAQAFPNGDHYSLVGPGDNFFLPSLIGESIYYFLKGFLNGNTIKSSLVLQTIGDAAKTHGFEGNNLNVWQWSCQGAKLLGAAEAYLPEGTSYVAESKAFYNQEIFINTFIQTLSDNKEFNFDKLFHLYLAMRHKVDLYPGAKEDEPFNIKIGNKDAKTSVQKADTLVKEIQQGIVNMGKLESAILKSCELIQQAEVKYNYDTNYQTQQANVPKCVDQLSKLPL